MRLKFALLFLILVVYSFAYNPVKSNDKDKALADNSKKVKVKKAELTAAQDEDDEGSKSLDEVEEDAGIDDDEQDDDEDVKEVPKKKSHVKQKKSKKPPAKKDKTRKSKKNDQEVSVSAYCWNFYLCAFCFIPVWLTSCLVQMRPIPESTSIPNMTSFDFFEMAREHRIDKLREIINDTPTGDIAKMRQVNHDCPIKTNQYHSNLVVFVCRLCLSRWPFFCEMKTWMIHDWNEYFSDHWRIERWNWRRRW